MIVRKNVGLRITPILFVIGFLVCGYTSLRYFLYKTNPVVRFENFADNGSYADTMQISCCGKSGYKIGQVDIKIDGTSVAGFPCCVSSKEFELPIAIETSALTNGKHKLEVVVVDKSFHANTHKSQHLFMVDNIPLEAEFSSTEYEVNQGGTIHLKFKANKRIANAQVEFLSKKYPCCLVTPHELMYEAFIPTECEELPAQRSVVVELHDHVGRELSKQAVATIKPVEFPKQKGFTVSPEKLKEERSVSVSQDVLNQALEKWALQSTAEKKWSGSFDLPMVVQRFSTPYGEQRVNAERGRYQHRAVDIVNAPRSVVWASQNGTVIIKDRYAISGNTVAIDHGMGVVTVYSHLDDFANIEVGDFIKKGNPVGKVGRTGFAVGYHLHWEVRVNNVPVDPLQWVKADF